MAPVLPIEDPRALERAARALRAGKLVAFPTDTVYGVGALPAPDGIAALYAAKGRPPDKPIPLLMDTPRQLAGIAPEAPSPAAEMAGRYWPGPLTLVVPGDPEVARMLGSADGSIGVRVPDHDALRHLIGLCGGSLAVTSANRSGGGDSRTAEEVERQIGEHLALILDGGPATASGASTIVDLTAGPPRLLRTGPNASQVLQTLRELGAAP